MAEGWSQHHQHLVEFDEPEAENAKPSIYVRVAEPADDDEKNWKVSIIGTSRVSSIFYNSLFSRYMYIFTILAYHSYSRC